MLATLALVQTVLAQSTAICENTCGDHGNGAFDLTCDDGGPGAAFSFCEYGSDCGDCGKRQPQEGDCLEANGCRSSRDDTRLSPGPPPIAPSPPPTPRLTALLGLKLNEISHALRGAAAVLSASMIDLSVDVLSLLLLACAVVPLLRWRLASSRRSRYDQLATGGSASLELGSADPDTQPARLVALDRHAQQQLLDTQRQSLELLGDLVEELRTLQSKSSDARSEERLAALAGRQRTLQAAAGAAPAPDPEAAVAALAGRPVFV